MMETSDTMEMAKKGAAANGHGRNRGANGTKRAASPRRSTSPSGKGLTVDRLFTADQEGPYDGIEWDQRKASITDDKGTVIFEQDNVEVPKTWSMLATNIVASKYFYGGQKTQFREHSVRQLVDRVAHTITDWGQKDGYFATPQDAESFYTELAWLCVNQYGSFNSPVWFNVGLHAAYGVSSDNRSAYHWNAEAQKIEASRDSYKHPQSSACFIQSVDDTMEDIMRLAGTEAMLFKYGSGTGTDLSTLRSSREKLSGGGTPSGPLSFMRVFDQVAAVIKSGGKTRRAAKMQSLKVTHPDIKDFITCKTREEQKAWALIDHGYDGSFGGEAYASVMFQNANLSVRVTDEFMQAVENDGDWQTRAVTTGDVVDTYRARDLMRLIAEGTHLCGDPGVQYDTTINRWHTCINSGRINASNPCSEYMFVDDSACNLASLNLMKFMDANGALDVERFRHAVRVFIIAQEILVDSASYPTEEIALNSHLFRALGLGYANLGAVLMSLGLPYDGEKGRAFAGALTAVMTGYAYATSAEIAAARGPFSEAEKNRDCMLNVIRMHADAVSHIDAACCPPTLLEAARDIWERVERDGAHHGFRNAQVTLLAPTGTIGFMMDCDTTGVEPDLALIKYKQLAGGGLMKIVNSTLESGLRRLGYNGEIQVILKYVDDQETIEGAPGFKEEHLPVFDCAFKPKKGVRSISHQAHVRMMAAVQPFLSGAISKTINMPKEATIEDVMQAYLDGWKLGLKSIAIYRDGSKRTQPMNTGKTDAPYGKAEVKATIAPGRPFRARMSATRLSVTHKFDVGGHEGYLTVGLYEDGKPGELFITMAKEGSTVGGTMDAFGTAISLCLQYGVPLQALVSKFSYSRFEPSGHTSNPEIRYAESLVDYIFRWLNLTFPNGKVKETLTPLLSAPQEAPVATAAGPAPAAPQRVDDQFIGLTTDAPACDRCGHITTRNGACFRCHNCGNSMGCS
jgi:ribonucleoside-diphosphate reductase alpha chain